jgi:hypothetical protein
MQRFGKATQKPREEPAGLDAFAAGAGNVHVLMPPPAIVPSTPEEREYGMNVRFAADEKAALVKLAAHEERSQQQIIKRLLRPVLLEAARAID